MKKAYRVSEFELLYDASGKKVHMALECRNIIKISLLGRIYYLPISKSAVEIPKVGEKLKSRIRFTKIQENCYKM